MEDIVYVTMEKELDEPFYICHDGRWVCIYINIVTDYRVVLSEDIETGYVEADSITEEGVTYYITGFCDSDELLNDDDSGVEYPVDFGIEKIEKSLTKEERELLQSFAEKNSGFIDEDIIDKALKEI